MELRGGSMELRGGLHGVPHNVGRRVCTTMFLFFWCPCMAVNVSVQYNGGLLPDNILLTQCYYQRGTRLNVMKMFCL